MRLLFISIQLINKNNNQNNTSQKLPHKINFFQLIYIVIVIHLHWIQNSRKIAFLSYRRKFSWQPNRKRRSKVANTCNGQADCLPLPVENLVAGKRRQFEDGDESWSSSSLGSSQKQTEGAKVAEWKPFREEDKKPLGVRVSG